jgi:hypothetical protein
VRFRNSVSDSLLLGNRMLAQGAGVALGDVDADGLVDIFLARTEGGSSLYRNRGGWRFEDVTERSGVGARDRFASGAAFADIEGDGDLDLVLLATMGPNAIFLNDGSGRFGERRDSGLDSTGKGGTTVTMADVDGDGDLDLYVANYKPYSPVDSITPEQRAFRQLVRQVAPGQFEVVPEFARDFKLVMRPDMGGLNLSMRAEPDDFYLNEGGRFTRVPMTSQRFRDAKGRQVAEAESFTLDAKFADLNGDGAPDLYVANDFEDPDQLWFNDGRGNFRLADWTAQRQTSNSSMGVDVGDVNADGRPDVFVVDMLSNDPRRLKTQMPTHAALAKRPSDLEMQLQQQRNTLFLNRGDETFGEVAMYAGLQASGWSWSTMFLDVDLDGWLDVLVTNGHLWDLMDADVQERLQKRPPETRWRRERWEFPRLALRNVAFRNRGDLTFEDASEAWGFGTEEDISHAIAAGDLDADGDLDVVVNRLGAPALLLRNDATSPRVAVRLVGRAPNTRGVGAKIRLIARSLPIQEREVSVGGLYLSHSDYQTAFAISDTDSGTLVVDWRDGRRTVVGGVRPNRLYEINAATATPVDKDSTRSAAERTLFEDATSELAGHAHVDAPFDDWERQFLLPNSLSHLGPGVAWFDYDRDGDEDLVVGSGRGGRLGIFRNERGRLVADRRNGAPAAGDMTTVLGRADSGNTQLVIGTSNWESAPLRGERAIADALIVEIGRAGMTTAPQELDAPPWAATGPLALGDYDGDGDLDLFVGGRAIAGRYPRAASSTLFVNDNGELRADSTHAGTFEGVGLVSAALFADIDGDGDADLLLAREWDSILLLLNERGRLTPSGDSWGLARWPSRWNGLASGDLDGDGRLDLVATSWGRNTMTPADSVRPLTMLYGSFGSAGEEEMLLAREDPRVRGLAPLNGYGRVRVAIPDLPARVPSFAAYADATVDRVLGPFGSKVERKVVRSLDHMVFFNRSGRFEARALPAEAQFAPAFHAGVADFNGDGAGDVILSQNFFSTAVGIPRYDGGRGLLLLGDGRGGLRPLPAAQSGIIVYGDQRGAAHADFDGDGRLDLVITQNSASTRLFRNRGATPGLRVRLRGPAANPDAIGAQVRVGTRERRGPVREIHAGSGYWSQNGAVQVFAVPAAPAEVWVRWPGGTESRVAVPSGAREIEVRWSSSPEQAGRSRVSR